MSIELKLSRASRIYHPSVAHLSLSLSLSHSLYTHIDTYHFCLSLFSKKMSIGIPGTSGGKNHSKIFLFHFSLWCLSHCQWIRQFAGGFESVLSVWFPIKMTENIFFKRDSYFFFPYFWAIKHSYFSFRFSIIVKSQPKCFCLFEDSWRIGWNYWVLIWCCQAYLHFVSSIFEKP